MLKKLYKIYDACLTSTAFVFGAVMVFVAGYSIGIVSGGLLGVIFAVLIGWLVGFSTGLLIQTLRVRYHMKRHSEIANMYNRDVGNWIFAKYFDGSPITNWVMKLSDDKPEIKVGNDDHMVAVDIGLFQEDPLAALGEAGREWEDWNQTHE